MTVTPLRERKAYQALERHHGEIARHHLRKLFSEDPGRGERLTAEAVGIYLDYSKNRITDETVRLLLELAVESNVAGRRDDMFAGKHINVSEDRAVLHVALRMPRGTSLVVDGVDVVKEVKAFLGARAHSCEEAGFARQRIAIDPGFGFGKTQAHNLELLRRLDEIAGDWPLAVGVSRKSMVARIVGRPDGDRLAGSMALAVLAVLRGALIIRAHDVAATVDALRAVAVFERSAEAQGTEANEIGT